MATENQGNERLKGGGASDSKLRWWQLSLLGVACTIGTGFFLGSGIAVRIGGPSSLISFLLAAAVTLVVFDALARMTASEPLEGSFRAYAKKAFGRWAGFGSGWVYWSSELLIVGSQLAALSLFTRYWLPNVPMWIFAACYGFLGLIVVLIGTKAFDRVENVFAVVKICAIALFIVLAVLVLLGVAAGDGRPLSLKDAVYPYFPNGFPGWWSSLLFAFYAFGGIEVMGLMATRLKKPEEAPKAGRIMLLLLAAVYTVSLLLAMTLVPWETFHSKKSPFMLALLPYGMPWAQSLFNAVLIVAGFSTMVASLFGVTRILVTLAKDKDAPPFFSKVWLNRPLAAIGLTSIGLALSAVLSMAMPGSIYEFFTTAAGLMLLYNWMFILATSVKLLKASGWCRVKAFGGMGVLLAAVSGAVFHDTSRPGFYMSLGFVAAIGTLTLIMRKRWKHSEEGQGGPHHDNPVQAFSPEQKSKSFKSKIRAKAD
ncbi:amino acid permease [Paenibacillus thailandensis]|uniref:Amino acid permease n=1 Tax=Paenibacillus thailandensis TaxID=393250 RepID=A0ABW5QUA1_9BACL